MKCDKCGREVAPSNDAVLIESIAYNQAAMNLFFGSRHFLPVVENEIVVCEGSPSRAQYVEGQPKDTRGYPYRPELEEKWRSAYQETQKRCSEMDLGSIA